MKFDPPSFFDLSRFSHRKLFDGLERAWELLGRPLAEYIAAQLKREIRGTVMDGAHIIGGDVFIGEGTIVEPGALIKGPAIIGRKCEIRHTAYIRENVIVGDGCVVGHATELKGCVLLDNVEAGHFAYIGDSVAGNRVMFGAGTKLANYKLNGSEVVVHDTGADYRTGLNKFGAIIGDGSKFGCNSVSSPGTVVGRKCIVMPCTAIAGCHPDGSKLGHKP